MTAADAFILALPRDAGDASRIPWWRVQDGEIADTGEGLSALHAAHGSAAGNPRVMGVAPAASTVLHRAAFAGLTQKQAEVAARLLAAEQSLLPPERLHSALGAPDDAGLRTIVAVDAATMAGWLAFADTNALDLASIVPVLTLVDPSLDDATLVRASFAGESFLRTRDGGFVDDPALVAHLAQGARIVDEAAGVVEAALIAALVAPPVELRCGAFARRRARWWGGDMLRRAAVLVGAILAIGLLIAVARIVRTHAEIARIDAAAEARVAQALTPAPPLDAAVDRLDARLAALGGGGARLSSPLAAVVQALEPNPLVTLDSVAWQGGGTLAVTLGGPSNAAINPVLIALQARGYAITATPRAGTDGRALADISVRSAR